MRVMSIEVETVRTKKNKSAKRKTKERVLIIGLDGARLDIIKKWIDEGALPHLKKIIEHGISGNLRTVFPPHSMLAWTSFMTGTNPGKHGIYNIQLQTPGTYELRVPNATMVKSKTIFRALSEHGFTVASINIPMTYPPQKVNGAVVSCWLTPPGAKYTYPPELQKELDRIGYKIQPSALHKTEKDFEKDVYDATEKRFEALKMILEKYDWSLAAVLDTGTEHMHHNYASFLDKEHPDYRDGQEDVVKKYYSFVGGKIGEIIEFLQTRYERKGDSVHVFIISDHGFGPSYGKIYLNNVLKKYGWFKEKKRFSATGRIFEFLESSGIANRLRNLLKVGFFDMMPDFVKKKIEIGRAGSVDADWTNTKAYCTGILGDIRINLVGREPEGIVTAEEYEKLRDEIIEKIKNDEDIGKYVAGVYKREELYTGPEVKTIPDLYVDFNKCCTSSPKTPDNEFMGKRTDAGYHTMDGIIIVKGPNIKEGVEIKDAELIDIAPTVMSLLGLEPEKGMDGKVLELKN